LFKDKSLALPGRLLFAFGAGLHSGVSDQAVNITAKVVKGDVDGIDGLLHLDQILQAVAGGPFDRQRFKFPLFE
jgi:hypothetical protein